MKPHLMRKSEFLADKGITEHNEAGIFVVRDGNKYQIGVEMDVDTVVFVDETKDQGKIQQMMNDVLYEIDDIRARFDDCFKE